VPKKPDEGFVIVKGAGKSYYPALRHYLRGGDRIAHYPPNTSEGVWSRPAVAKTFMPIPWAKVKTREDAKAAYERELALIAERAETDRLCKPIDYFDRPDMFKCISCGSLVWNRSRHLADHQRKNLVDPAFHQTVELLFGDMAVAADAQDEAANMILKMFGVQP